MKAGDVLHLTRAASPQFVRPIFFRLIRIRTDLHSYHGWAWLDGYQLNKAGEAIARRELYVLEAGPEIAATEPPAIAKSTGKGVNPPHHERLEPHAQLAAVASR